MQGRGGRILGQSSGLLCAWVSWFGRTHFRAAESREPSRGELCRLRGPLKGAQRPGMERKRLCQAIIRTNDSTMWAPYLKSIP